MMTESKKRQTSLNILQRLRQKGLPERESQVDSMFDSLTGGEVVSEQDGEDEEGSESDFPEYELQSPEQQAKEREKKKGPKLEPKKVDQFKKGFKSIF